MHACSYEEVLNPLGFVMNSIQDNQVAVQSRKVLRTTVIQLANLNLALLRNAVIIFTDLVCFSYTYC